MMRAPLCTFFLPSHLHLPSERLSSARASVAPGNIPATTKAVHGCILGKDMRPTFQFWFGSMFQRIFIRVSNYGRSRSQYHVIRFNSVGGNANFNIEIAIQVDPGSRTYREWDRANWIVDRG
ncbi:hypothetical protein HanRHA438_Chr10g0462071 [Helianthus annuus]|nr:hypothetical protein HanRHA438_Chr10g0462071 [Helianthus annuus]